MTNALPPLSETPLGVIKRRPVGKTAWRVTVNECIESERALLQILRAVANRHPNDVETQRLLTQGALDLAECLTKLHELALYRDTATSEAAGDVEAAT